MKVSLQNFSKSILKELQHLCNYPKSPPDQKEWSEFFPRFVCLLILFEGGDGAAGKMAQRLPKEMESLWLFLDQQDVEPTNNRAEKALPFEVLWRRRRKRPKVKKGSAGPNGFFL